MLFCYEKGRFHTNLLAHIMVANMIRIENTILSKPFDHELTENVKSAYDNGATITALNRDGIPLFKLATFVSCSCTMFMQSFISTFPFANRVIFCSI